MTEDAMTQTDQELDRIERSIDIDASAAKVWSLIDRAGWWINDGDVEPELEMRNDGEYDVVVHPTHGTFRFRTLSRDEPRYVSYHWVDNVAPEAGTTVEFWIEEREGGVTLRVVESGFSGLQKERAAIDNQIAENTNGWELELAAAQRFVLGRSA